MNAKPTDHDDPRPTRSSGWVVFFLLGALLGVHTISLMGLPSVEPDHWREFTTDPKMLANLADDFQSAGAMQLGSAVMSMAVAGRWFRLADPRACGLFWYFPALCAWSMLTTWAVELFLTVGAIAVVALAATFRQFFPSRTR